MNVPGRVTSQLNSLKRVLLRAEGAGQLRTAPHEIHAAVKASRGEVPAVIASQFPAAWAIVGGEKDFGRVATSARLIRDDGAWIHFAVTVDPSSTSPVAYNFEIVFEQFEVTPPYPPFVRVDLNEPGHSNDLRGMRCHLHPSHDDIQIKWAQEPPEHVLEHLLSLRKIKER